MCGHGSHDYISPIPANETFCCDQIGTDFGTGQPTVENIAPKASRLVTAAPINGNLSDDRLISGITFIIGASIVVDCGIIPAVRVQVDQ